MFIAHCKAAIHFKLQDETYGKEGSHVAIHLLLLKRDEKASLA